MRQDRRSAYEALELAFEEAMANEFRLGLVSPQDAGPDVARFAAGAVLRHGGFDAD